MAFDYGDHVRITEDLTRRSGLFSTEVVVPAGAVGRVVGVPIFATNRSLYDVTFAVGVGVFHDEEVSGAVMEKVTPRTLVGAR